ncbi:MAG: iron-containing alcohol dehydrogenase [Clostridia bacterium]|nr:iron-containing alcohol dehydrogenase [Clostridia bacterium]
MNKFKIKTEVKFSDNAIDALLDYKNVNAAIVTDEFMNKSGKVKMITDKLSGCNRVDVFDEVKPDPPISLIIKGLEFLEKCDTQIVVALGGGSSIDAAKAMVFMAKKVTGKDLKLVAIPTTSGTGSEVTQFAVITDEEKGIKYPLVDEDLLPDLAILIPELVTSVPPSVTADTGFDVITHAMEAYVSTLANDASDALAEKSLKICFEYLPVAYKEGDNLIAREKMHSASCLAGMAFNEVGLGINHGIAHALGAKFHIPHGRANAMLLPHVVEFNADLHHNFGKYNKAEAMQRIAEISRMLRLPHDTKRIAVESLVEEIKYMMKMMKIPATLKEAGVTKEDYEASKADIIKSALNDSCTKTNPREVTEASVERILSKIAIW